MTLLDFHNFIQTSSESSFAEPSLPGEEEPYPTDVDIVIAICLLAGIWQVIFAFLTLGKLSWILSDVLVSGYTCGAAIHVITSQLKAIFGVPLSSHDGPLKIYYVRTNTVEVKKRINKIS